MLFRSGIDAFASGNDKDAFFWQSLIRQMILEGLLQKDIEEYGVLKFTKKGEAFLKKPKPFSIVLNKLYDNADGEDDWEVAEDGEGAAVDQQLFTQLMELRQQEAKKKSLPPFVIFLETSLQDMATSYPITLEGLDRKSTRLNSSH